MSDATVLISESILQETADAIREKEGSSNSIKPIDFANKIKELGSNASSVIQGIITIADSQKITMPELIGAKNFLFTAKDFPIPTVITGGAGPILTFVVMNKEFSSYTYLYGKDVFHQEAPIDILEFDQDNGTIEISYSFGESFVNEYIYVIW